MHGVLEFGRVLERNLEAALTELVLGLSARFLKLLSQSRVLGLVGNDLGTLLGDLVSGSRGLDFEIDLRGAVHLGLMETFLSDRRGMLHLLSFGSQLTDIDTGTDISTSTSSASGNCGS
jgi:hypothetical protein